MCEPEGRPNERDVAEAALFHPEERDRLDRFLSGVSDLSRNQVQRLIREGAGTGQRCAVASQPVGSCRRCCTVVSSGTS